MITILFLFIEFFVQIGISAVFFGMGDKGFVEEYIDVSKVLRQKDGDIRVYYTDIVRIAFFLILIIPYAFSIFYVIDRKVVSPLKKLVSELKKIDGNQHENRISIETKYEFSDVKDAFNNAIDRLEISEKQRSMLIIGMAHDLKTPITTLRGYSQALMDGVIKEEKQKKEYLLAIYRKSIQLEELIYTMFDYVKLMAVQDISDLKQVDCVEVLRENIALAYTDFEEKNIKFSFKLPDASFYMRGDCKQLNRVFSNIYGNALKHNKPGDEVYTEVEIERDIKIGIHDTGEKIPENIASHVFEPFVMGDASRRTGGSGLGLSIVAKIVELHNGKIELIQEDGKPYTKSFIIRFEKDKI